MIKTLIEAYRDNGLNTKYGDLAYCLVDADCDSRKNDQLAGATNLANKHNIELIVSAPCFERRCYKRIKTIYPRLSEIM